MTEHAKSELPKPLTKAELASALASGDIDPMSARIVWSVANKVLVQDLSGFSVPLGADLRPVRRIGTYPGAKNRIGMYPIVRDHHAFMLETESRLEMAHVRRLDIDPTVKNLHAQPMLMYWRVADRGAYMIPDLLYRTPSGWIVADVKTDEALAKPHVQAKFDLAARSLLFAGVTFRTLGSISQQEQVNLRIVTRYRRVNPHLLHELETAWQEQPTHIAWLLELVGPTAAREVLMTLLANGLCSVDLNAAIRRATKLTWADRDHPVAAP